MRYVLPLREGGSLPAIVDTDEAPSLRGHQYAVKFRGAGQGPRALVAEAIAAGLARALGLPVPDAAIVHLAEGFGAGEPDPEIQDLLRASVGENFGLRYLSGAIGFDPVADRGRVTPAFAADVVWFDALISNVDRSHRNPNILVWQDPAVPRVGSRAAGLWLIDHGAAFYFHHGTAHDHWHERAHDPFPMIKSHILRGRAESVRNADARLRPLLTEAAITEAVAGVPESWLGPDAAAERRAYVRYLMARLTGERPWVEEAENARTG